MKREKLVAVRRSKGWSQEQLAEKIGVARNTLSAWERGIADPYPVHVQRLCEVFALSASDLDLVSKEMISNFVQLEGSSLEIMEQIAVGIAACNTLSDNGGRNEIVLATQISNTYLPTLQALLRSSKHPQAAALLASKVYQHQHGTAYHLRGVAQSLMYSEQAVEYARMSKDVTELVVSLTELASTYEWPLPPMSVAATRKKGLELLEEVMSLLKKHHDTVPFQVQAWAYTLYAKFLALNAKKQETYTAIGKAEEAIAKKDNEDSGLYFNETNVIRQRSIAHSYLSEQDKAISGFLSLIDPNDPGIAPKLPMPSRTRLSIISETVFSLLKAPIALKDKELTIRLWNAQFDMAQALKSATYIKEAWATYDIMECLWPDDSEVAALKEALHNGETVE